MIPRGMQGVANLWSVKTVLVAAVAVFGLTMSAQAQCSHSGGQGGGGGGRGGSGGQSSGNSLALTGLGTTGTSSTTAQSVSSMVTAQMETAQYLSNMQASHNAMMQQIHQHQNRQLEGLRQASANRKRIAAQRAVEISSKSKSKSGSASTKSIQLTQAN